MATHKDILQTHDGFIEHNSPLTRLLHTLDEHGDSDSMPRDSEGMSEKLIEAQTVLDVVNAELDRREGVSKICQI